MPVYPNVRRYGDIGVESFEDYYSRWPIQLNSIPIGIVEDWIYRHWRDFEDHWIALSPHLWSYQLVSFSRAEVLSIGHIGNWISELDAEGIEYVGETHRSNTRLAQYMRSHGTFPKPIIVAKGAGRILHPRGCREFMKEPYQLIEGHCRLACIRGMINTQFHRLAHTHLVWVVSIPEGLGTPSHHFV